MTFPVQTCTKVGDVKAALAASLFVRKDQIDFVVKQGCGYIKQLDVHEAGRRVTVKGITSFTNQPFTWPYPIGIIGTGYNGLKTAMHYLKDGNTNIQLFDRHDKVGGYCWIQ